MVKTKFEFQKMLVVSTAHISESCNAWLYDQGLTILASQYGFVLWKGLETPSEFPELKALLKLADKQNCECLMLDRDGPEIEGFQKFDW